jgi:beta-glucosidase
MKGFHCLLVILILWCVSLAYDEDEQWSVIDDDIRRMIKSLSLEYQIGQMVQLDISMFLTPELELNKTELLSAVERFGIGSLLNTPTALSEGTGAFSVQQWRNLVSEIQTIAINHGPKIPILYGLDSVHGANFVSGATLFPQQIGMAASFNRELTQKAYSISYAIVACCTSSIDLPAVRKILDLVESRGHSPQF